MRRNPYLPLSKEAIEEKKKTVAEANDMAAKAITAAKICLASDDFKRYKEMCELSVPVLIDEICGYSESDPVKYAFEVRKKIERLIAIKYLSDRVSLDASTQLSKR